MVWLPDSMMLTYHFPCATAGLAFIFNPKLMAQLLHATLAESSAPTLGMLRYAGMHIGTIGVPLNEACMSAALSRSSDAGA